MGFYQKEPVDAKNSTAVYLNGENGAPGLFVVYVKGDAPNYSYGFNLVRDPHFVGGLKIDSFGWTGPLGEGSTRYKVKGSFPGSYLPKIVLSGSNGDFLLDVEEIVADKVDDYVKTMAERSASY